MPSVTANDNNAFLLSQEVKAESSSPMGFSVVGTTAIVMDYDVNSDPTTSTYTYVHVPNTDETFNWFSAISYASADPRDDQVYILGTNSCAARLNL